MLRTIVALFCACASMAYAAEVGITQNRILLGMANALTGPAAALGTELKEGALACFGHINAEGGVHGRKIEIVSLDDGYEPMRTEAATRKLLDEHRVFALFGFVGTPTSAAAVRVAKRHGVPYIAPFTGAEFLRNPVNPLVFNVRASYYDETEVLVRRAIEDLAAQRIAVVAQDDSFGDTVRTGVNRAMFRRGMKLVAEGRFPRNSLAVADAVAKTVVRAPEVIVMVGGYASLAAFVREYRRAAPAEKLPVFMTVSFVGTAGFIREAGAAGEGVIISQVMPSPWDTQHPLVAHYHRDLPAGAVPSYGALEGCLDARVMTEALRRAGKEPSRTGLMRAFEGMKDVTIEGIHLDYGRYDHQGMDRVYLTRIQGGKPVPITRLIR